MAGDLNARHTSWFNARSNRNGHTVHDYAHNENIAVLSPDTPTHFPYNNSTPSIIDIVLNKNHPSTILPMSLPLLSSDHNPVIFYLNNPDEDAIDRHTYNYKTTNWTRLRQIINDRLVINNDIETPADIENEVTKLTKILQDVRNKTTKQTKITPREETIPDDIKNLITFKNRIKRIWQRNHRDIDRRRLNDLQQTITLRLKNHREETWNAKISNLARQDNSLWRMTRLLKRPFKRVPTLVQDDVPISGDKDKAEALAKYLQTTNTTQPNQTDFHDNVANTVNRLNDRFPIPLNKYQKLITTPEKIKKLLKSLPNHKAPGPDSIPNILLKNIPKKAIVQLCYIINSIIKLQYFPEQWKIAIVVPFLKPNKQPQNPSSYRPICLLNTLSKVTERVILEALNKFVEKKKLLPAVQFGFRGGHSTSHALCRVVQDTLQAYNKKQCTVLLLIDIEKAYDSVWHNGLIYKLQEVCKLSPYIVALIKSFISARHIMVRVNESYSSKIRLSAGVPQGAILSPLLFNLYTSDIPSHPMTRLLLYANDTVIYGQFFYAQTAAQRVRYHLGKLLEYYKTWKIKINADKTKTINFNRKFTNNKIITKIKIHDKTIEEKNSVKYLGVTLDKRLSFAPHISQTISRTYATLNKLYPLVNRRSRLSTDNKLGLYKTIFRPIMTYACVSWNLISDTQCKRLQTTQNKLLRLLTNSNRYITIAELHRKAKVSMMRDFIMETSQKFFAEKARQSTITSNITDVRGQDNPTHTHKLLHQRLPIYEQRR